ncbi:acyl-CoA synthase [Oceanicola granulosus HTCC2516]|uniref:Acyl-CoA synthase n=1 Tax=Oceanicola granulosus (strain ATCC BAA-861 / DSM 15982 / KCTC 12143 / HTCC2516) TaxID=314256 RepID=Q2CFH1_OCEGH|nr:acyl-CoA synthetase [Oceanicola granulosus]EAR51511.1 acyl-CoA synthase [Oceanicola granulosus HTCC2516]
MGFASKEDLRRIEEEMAWAERDVPSTMYGLLSGTAERHGARKAVTFQMFSDPKAPDVTLTWSELHDEACRTANLLRELGIGETDVVAFLLPNSMETVLTYLGGTIAGVVNPINPLLEPRQIAAILNETGAKVLVTLKAFPKTDVAQKAAEAVLLAPKVETVLEVDLLRYMTGLKKFIVPLLRPKMGERGDVRVLDFAREVAKRPAQLTFADSAGDRVAALFHTGGTTGMPKVAQHRYEGIIYNAWICRTLLFREDDVQICPLPLFHVFATIVSLGASLGSGAQVVFPTPQGYRGEGVFDNFWKLVERHKVSFMIGVPTAFSALMQRKVDADTSSLKLAFSGSSPLPVELYKRFEAAAGLTLCEGYGLTEATCLVSINPPEGEKKVGSIGLPFPYTDVKIVDFLDGAPRDCETDEVGEICVSNPGVAVAHTYSQAEKNQDLYHDGRYLRTGDLGKLDSDGYLWITGRAKDLIIRGGHNIDPAVIEEALAAHEAVALGAAIGQPDAHAGEVPCAYVEAVAGATPDEAELRAFANARIHERAAHLKHLEVIDEIPKTAVGKPLKNELRKRAIARVYGTALAEAGVAAQVAEVVEDRSRGLVARIARTGDTDEAAVNKALGCYTRPWDWAE